MIKVLTFLGVVLWGAHCWASVSFELQYDQQVLARQEWALNGEWMFTASTAPERELAERTSWQTWEKFSVPGVFPPIAEHPLASRLGAPPSSIAVKSSGPVWYGVDFKLNHVPEQYAAHFWFEGISATCEVFLNGVAIGTHHGAYTPFEITIPEGVLKTEANNFLSLRVADLSVATQTFPPAVLPGAQRNRGGIWGDVRIVITGTTRIKNLSVRPTMNALHIVMQTHASRAHPESLSLMAEINLTDPQTGTSLVTKYQQRLGRSSTHTIILESLAPKLWSPETPQLYDLEVRLLSGREVLDQLTYEIGFRTIAARHGRIYLNQSPYYLQGVNVWLPIFIHHDDALIERYLTLLKQAGVNAIRFPWEPPARAWLDCADRLGIMCVVGIPMDSRMYQPEFFATPDFMRQVRSELTAMIQSYNHHPSVILWSVGNELGQISSGQTELITHTNMLLELAKQTDPTRLVVAEVVLEDGQPLAGSDVESAIRMHGWYHDLTLGCLQGIASGLRTPQAGHPVLVTECVGAYLHPTENRFWDGLPQDSAGWRAIGRKTQWTQPEQYRALATKSVTGMLRSWRGSGSRLSGQFIQIGDMYLENLWDAQKIAPRQPGYNALSEAYGPVGVSQDESFVHIALEPRFAQRLYLHNDRMGDIPLTEITGKVRLLDFSGQELSASMTGWTFPAAPPSDNSTLDVPIALPSDTPKGQFVLRAEVFEEQTLLAANEREVVLYPQAWPETPALPGKRVYWAGNDRRIEKIMTDMGLEVIEWDANNQAPRADQLLVLDDSIVVRLSKTEQARISEWIAHGRRAVSISTGDGHPFGWLSPEFAWEQVEVFASDYIEMVDNDHPVFVDMEPYDLHRWNRFRNTIAPIAMKPSFSPGVTPLGTVARWNSTESWSVLSLVAHQQGIVLATTIDFVSRFHIDPAAHKFFRNLLVAASSIPLPEDNRKMELPLYRFQVGTPADEAFLGQGWAEPQRVGPIHFRTANQPQVTIELPVLPQTQTTVEIVYVWSGQRPAVVIDNKGTQLAELPRQQQRVRFNVPSHSNQHSAVTLFFLVEQSEFTLAEVTVWAEVDELVMEAHLNNQRAALRQSAGINLCADWMGAVATGGLRMGEVGPHNLINGIVSDFSLEHGIAEAAQGDPFIIRFPHPTRLSRVHLFLPDQTQRKYQFRIEGTGVGGDTIPLADYSSTPISGWVKTEFTPTVVQELRVVGTADVLHLVEVQGFEHLILQD